MAERNLEVFVGRSPDSLTYLERKQLAGKWVALELYSPATLPLRKIEAMGDGPADCIRGLRARGLDPGRYEFLPIQPFR